MDNRTDDLPADIPWVRFAVAAILALLLAHVADVWVWQSLRDPRVNDRDWGRLLRSAGYVPTWLFGALALWLSARMRSDADDAAPRRWHAGALALAPALGGGVAELVKLVVRRQRPGSESAEYLFRPFDVELWSTRGLGMASSHAAVAFGAAAVLSRVFPGTAPVWYLLAVGCAATRVLAGAHYLSDVVGGAAIGWLAAVLLCRWFEKRG